MDIKSSCVKIYLCSDPEDSVVERRALRERVFPRLREHCRHTRGLDLRVIDPFESSDARRWPDEKARQQLIQECRRSSAGPFLLALIGHQYGRANLPTQVEVNEYQLLLQESQQAGVSTQELQREYQRDENTIPPSYCRRPPLTHTCCPQLVEVKKEEEIKRKATEDELRRTFQVAVSLCVHRGHMTPQRAQSYCRSALDADLRFALHNRPSDDIIGRCLVYHHKVINAKGEREKLIMNSQLQPQQEAATFDLSTTPTDGQLFSELCDDFLPGLITSTQLLVYTTSTECDSRHGYTTARRRGYAERLCQQVYANLLVLIDSVEISEDSPVEDLLAKEQAEQDELCDILSRFYDIIRPEEEKIRAYVEQREHQRPLVVTGGPCTGKAVLLAHCAQQIKSWLPDCDPIVITYFCHLSINPTPKHLLVNLCHQIAGRYQPYGSSSEQNPSDKNDPSSNCSSTSNLVPLHEPISSDIIKPDICLSELRQRLSSLLFLMPHEKQPLYLIFDGLDHIENNFGLDIIVSLPSPLPPNVKVLLSVSSTRTQVLQTIDPGPADGSGCVYVLVGAVERKQCVKMLASLLSGSGRRVTSGQQALVNQALTSCRLTLYARLLHLLTRLWHSDSDVTDSSLPDGVHSSISALLDQLEHKHGSSMVARAVSFLTLSRTGLTEAELADLLSGDDEVLSEYAQQDRSPASSMRVPQVDVETLLLDLRRFLIRRTVAGSQVLFWVSRHFTLVVARRYLGPQDVRIGLHSSMADYFTGRRAGGAAEPLPVSKESEIATQTAPCIDRQPPSQPFIFTSSTRDQVNLRKVLELPHHLRQSSKWEEFEDRLLMSVGFHQAMVRAGLLGNLVAMLEGEEGSSLAWFSRERALLASVLKSSAYKLQRSPLQFPTVMETSLLPYLEVFPALKGYVRAIREERRRRGNGLGVVLCPAPSFVPSIQCLKCGSESEEVEEVGGTQSGVVAEILSDGTVWCWKGCGREVVQLSPSCEQNRLEFTGLKISGHFMLLSTRCNSLFLWDVTGPDMFLRLTDPFRKPQHQNRIEGFVAGGNKFFIWWKEESSVSIFDASGEAVAQFQCRSCVTSLVCSSDGFHICCGQEGGTVSIFHTQTRLLLSTCSHQRAVVSIILREQKGEMACVDRTGSLTLWDATNKTEAPRFLKEASAGDGTSDVLQTDCPDEFCSLLVCQRHQVSLWDTCDWELWKRFSALQGRAFTQAVLSQDGHLLLALLDTCPLVLVWRVSTGECVLSLGTDNKPHTLLRTSSDVICVCNDGCLTVWDSEMIDAAGAEPRMRSRVKELVVERGGGWFYTSDGSEAVWRWSAGTGLPHAYLLHDGSVEKLRLSPDSSYLVTLSAKEIYVWRTETGQNILRLSGGMPSDILITPNNHYGVSISEQHLSRVWKLAHGSIVCSIHLYLSDAQVSPESTFLIGRQRGDLVAASLWSGSISKRFSCVASSEQVVAFTALSKHPDFVVVMVASGSMYTWKVAEETVCRHFQLPNTLHCQPQDFQMSSDGSYALLSTADEAIHLLDLSQVMLFSFKAEGPVVTACLDKTGCYVAYIAGPTLHSSPVLTVVRLADRERIGHLVLEQLPLTLVVCERQQLFVGFEDGSVGLYSISDAATNGEADLKGPLKLCPFDSEPVKWFHLVSPNVTWP